MSASEDVKTQIIVMHTAEIIATLREKVQQLENQLR